MAATDRTRWDNHFRQNETKPYPLPDPFLLQYTPPASDDTPRRALDAAAGIGQNGIWMAEQGYTVDIMDISRVALNRARAEAASRNLRNVNFLQTDFDSFEIDEQTYDVACVFRYLKRDMMTKLKASVVKGGRFLYETFNLSYLEHVPEFNIDFLLEPGELIEMFEDWTVLFAAEEGHISQIVAVNTPPKKEPTDEKFDW